jgi:hypothetical protein
VRTGVRGVRGHNLMSQNFVFCASCFKFVFGSKGLGANLKRN